TVTTIDSASQDDTSPHAAVLSSLARAFRRHRATPCGFCTPGMLLTAADLLSECPVPSEDDVRNALAGTWGRCGDEHTVVRAVLSAAAELHGLSPAAEGGSRGGASQGVPSHQRTDPTTSDRATQEDHTLAGHPGAS